MNGNLLYWYQKFRPYLLPFTLLLFFLPTLLLADTSQRNTSSTDTAIEKSITHLAKEGVSVVYRLDSAPMQFQNKRGQADGILIDVWRLWSLKSGIPVRFIGAYNKEAQEMVADGRADVNAGLFESDKRAEFLEFSIPILDSGYTLFYQPDIKSINRIEEFQPYTVGVTRGSFHESYLREHYPELQLIQFDGYQKLFKAAKNREVDGFITQLHYLQYHLSQETYNPGYKYIKPSLYTQAYKASVKKGNKALLNVINKNLPLITQEDRRVVHQNWVGKLTVSDKTKSTIVLTDAEELWLNKHPVINIGVDGNWPPIDFVDNDGHHTGIAHEFINNISRQLGIEFNIIPGPTFEEMLAKVKSGELKVASSIVTTPERDKDLWFTDEFFTVHKVIVSKKNAKPYRNLKELFGKVVAIERDFSTMKQLRELYPEIRLKPVKSTLDALREVSWGHADAYVGNSAVAQWIIQQQQISNLHFTGDPDLGPAPQRFAIHKDPQWKPLLGILNKALDQIDSKQRNTIYQQWLGRLGISDRIRKRLNLTAAEQLWLDQHPDIRLGVDSSFPPIEFIGKDGKYQGLSAEFIKTIAGSLNISMEPTPSLSWEQVLEKAKQKQIDVIPAMAKSSERDEYLNFTEPYLNFPFVIFLQDRHSFTTTLEDLHGKTVAIEKSYVTEEYLRTDHPEIKLMLFDNTKQALEKVSLGIVDAYVGNLAVGSYLLTTHGISNVKVGGTTPYNFDLRIGVRKDWPQLVSILNKFFTTLSNEEKSQIRNRWLAIKYDVLVDDSIVRQVVIVTTILLFVLILWMLYTRRKHARLRQSEEQLNRIINAIPLAIVLTDQSGVIIRANPYAAKEIETDANTVVGRRMAELYDDPAERDLVLQKLKHDGLVKDAEVHFRTDKGGVVTGLLSALPIRLGSQTLNIGMFVNLTERIKMEKELKEAKEKSDQISQFKSDFLANMSHEIRTPMNAILGMSHLALQTGLDDRQYDYINNVKISAHNLLGIINDILDFSKIEAGKLHIEKTGFQLEEVLLNLANMMSLKAEEKGLELLFRQGLSIPNNLYGDPLRLGQVLINLVQNAIKFTDKGEVVISVESSSVNDHNAQITFSVSDTGIGIDPEQVRHLFDPFIQADSSISRKHGGTGLGLSISREIVELMGGELTVESQLEKGSTFSFTIDFDKQTDVAEKWYQLDPDLTGMQVLIVDDNPVAQKILQEMLESFSFQVSVASSAEEAYALLTQSEDEQGNVTEAFELVLMDWKMPVINGIEATRHIQTRLSLATPPKVIMITAYGRDEIMQENRVVNLDGFLSKPITPSTLFDTIMTVFNQQNAYRYSPHVNLIPQRLKGTVLLAEDNIINQQVARELLEGFGLLVVVASNGRETVNSVRNSNFDLVLMDIQMPEMDGIKATTMIRSDKRYEDLPIIAMTAHAMEGDKENCLASGMNDYLSKPIDPEKLQEMLVKWLGEKKVDDRYRSKITKHEDVYLPETLPGIDVNWGLQRVGGNKKLFIKLLKDFDNHHAGCCQELQQLLADNAIDDACRLVHTIHGVAGNMGARELQRSAQMLELSIKENPDNRQNCALLVNGFCQQVNIVFDGLKAFISQLNKEDKMGNNQSRAAQHHNSQDNNVPSASSTNEILALIQALENLLSEGDSEALAVLEAVKHMMTTEEHNIDESVFIQLEQQINDYDYDEALLTLSQLSGKFLH